MTTRVMFRMDTDEAATRENCYPEVTAVFPDEYYFGEKRNHRRSTRVCYAHIGQHGPCTLEWMKESTRAATEQEYAPLLKELISIGYDDLKIVKRFRE